MSEQRKLYADVTSFFRASENTRSDALFEGFLTRDESSSTTVKFAPYGNCANWISLPATAITQIEVLLERQWCYTEGEGYHTHPYVRVLLDIPNTQESLGLQHLTGLFAAQRASPFALPATTDGAPPPTYTFTLDHPPYLKDFGLKVIDLPDAALSQVLGTATWTKVDRQDTVPNPFGGGTLPTPGWVVNTSLFTLTRIRRWVISGEYRHYASPTTDKFTTVIDYSKSEQVAFAQSLETSVGVSDFFGLDASVKGTISLTSTETQQWSEQVTHEQDKQYVAGAYIAWQLMDDFYLSKDKAFSGRCCATTHVQTSNVFRVRRGVFEDFAPDALLPQIFHGQISRIIRPLGGISDNFRTSVWQP